MKLWHGYGEKLKKNSNFFLAMISGVVIWNFFETSAEDLAGRFHFISGICVSWFIMSALDLVFRNKEKTTEP